MLCQVSGLGEDFIAVVNVKPAADSSANNNIIGRFGPDMVLKNTLISDVAQETPKTLADNELTNIPYWCGEVGTGGKYIAFLMYSSSSNRYFSLYTWQDVAAKTALTKSLTGSKDLDYVDSLVQIDGTTLLATTFGATD